MIKDKIITIAIPDKYWGTRYESIGGCHLLMDEPCGWVPEGSSQLKINGKWQRYDINLTRGRPVIPEGGVRIEINPPVYEPKSETDYRKAEAEKRLSHFRNPWDFYADFEFFEGNGDHRGYIDKNGDWHFKGEINYER